LLKIYDATLPKKKNSLEATQHFSKAISFSCLNFGPEMPGYHSSEWSNVKEKGKIEKQYSYYYPMVAADQRGHIYAFDFARNRYVGNLL
jgi:hypothetical protein